MKNSTEEALLTAKKEISEISNKLKSVRDLLLEIKEIVNGFK